jgi:tetratricopeptide (TPR) repeat protein
VLQKLGTLYDEQMGDASRAAAAWRRILGVDPRHGRALRTLRERLSAAGDWDGVEALYADANDFEALADVLSGEADRVEQPAAKVDLSFRAARVLSERIGEPMRAFRSYERVLSVDASNAKAARALIPIYEREEKWTRLAGVLDVVLKSLPADALDEKLDVLQRLRRIALDDLRDGDAAFAHAAAAYALAPDDERVIEGLEEAAQKAASFDRLIDLYLAQADRAPEAAMIDLRRRVAKIASDRLNRIDVAVAQLRLIVDAAPSDHDAIVALDVIYRAQQRHPDLRALLLHRLKRADDQADRWSLLKELAQLEEETLGAFVQ